MILNFIKTKEISNTVRQMLDSDAQVVDTALSSTKDVVKKGIDYNQAVIKSVINALASARNEADMLINELMTQSIKIEERALDTLERTSTKAQERIDEWFDRVGNPGDTLGQAIKESALDPADRISRPSVEVLKKVSDQLSDLPGKSLKKVALAEQAPEVKAAALAAKSGTTAAKAKSASKKPAAKSKPVARNLAANRKAPQKRTTAKTNPAASPAKGAAAKPIEGAPIAPLAKPTQAAATPENPKSDNKSAP